MSLGTSLMAILGGLLLVVVGCSEEPERSGAVGSPPAEAPRPLFKEISAASGLPGPDPDLAPGQFELWEIMGAGVGLLDVDGNGRLDVIHPRFPRPGRLEE